ncbi:MAG: hypothetical protein WBA74_23860 [Cyclobacteriaceae bacterium]
MYQKLLKERLKTTLLAFIRLAIVAERISLLEKITSFIDTTKKPTTILLKLLFQMLIQTEKIWYGRSTFPVRSFAKGEPTKKIKGKHRKSIIENQELTCNLKIHRMLASPPRNIYIY